MKARKKRAEQCYFRARRGKRYGYEWRVIQVRRGAGVNFTPTVTLGPIIKVRMRSDGTLEPMDGQAFTFFA